MKKKIFQGIVVKNLNDKTITVNVERKFMDKKYKKYVKKHKKFLVHDEKNKCEYGDVVKIIECRPRSKTKKFDQKILGRFFLPNLFLVPKTVLFTCSNVLLKWYIIFLTQNFLSEKYHFSEVSF